MVEDMGDYDLYDVLAELGYGLAPRTRHDRTLAFTYKHEDWMQRFAHLHRRHHPCYRQPVRARRHRRLENPNIFQTPEVKAAGGLAALQQVGNPSNLLTETKTRNVRRMSTAATAHRYNSRENELPEGWRWIQVGRTIQNVQNGFACGS